MRLCALMYFMCGMIGTVAALFFANLYKYLAACSRFFPSPHFGISSALLQTHIYISQTYNVWLVCLCCATPQPYGVLIENISYEHRLIMKWSTEYAYDIFLFSMQQLFIAAFSALYFLLLVGSLVAGSCVLTSYTRESKLVTLCCDRLIWTYCQFDRTYSIFFSTAIHHFYFHYFIIHFFLF